MPEYNLFGNYSKKDNSGPNNKAEVLIVLPTYDPYSIHFDFADVDFNGNDSAYNTAPPRRVNA